MFTGCLIFKDMEENFCIEPIAHIRTGFSEKFGIPRQSGLVNDLTGKIVFEKKYRRIEAVRGLEEFSHIWLLWLFSDVVSDDFHPTVRPPRLGGNDRIGVFATRSPFRPNKIGLSCVKLEYIDTTSDDSPVIYVSGIDMLDNTPIIDIKPYIPLTDMRLDAKEGYTEETKKHTLDVIFENETDKALPDSVLTAVKGILQNDPRPGYAADPTREYGFVYSGYNIVFCSDGKTVFVKRITKK